jgi:hypothetical protein
MVMIIGRGQAITKEIITIPRVEEMARGAATLTILIIEKMVGTVVKEMARIKLLTEAVPIITTGSVVIMEEAVATQETIVMNTTWRKLVNQIGSRSD